MDSKKILNLVTIVMFVITVVLLGLFMFGGEVPNQPYTTPVYTSTLLIGHISCVVLQSLQLLSSR